MPESDRPPPRSTLGGPYAANLRARYVELGLRSAFSFQQGASDAAELAAAANAGGYEALGIADLNSLAGIVRFHTEALTARLRPLIGCRVRLVTGETFLAYPKDRAAYGRLCRLLSDAKMRDLNGAWQAKGACQISLEALVAHAEGLQLILVPDGRSELQLARLGRHLPGLRHLAVSYHYRGDDRARINRLDRLAREAGLSILATNDVLYHHPSRRPLQDVLTCIRNKTTVQKAGYLLAANAERHLKSVGEMCRLFAEWPHAIAATRAVADACHFALTGLSYHYPQETVPPGETAQSQLEKLTWAGAADRYPAGLPDPVRETIVTELEMIARKKISHYFLTIHEIVVFARSRGILCQGRGSAANSAVCYVLGITSVDPATHDLLFERFISEERDEPPDIDVDFEHERREEVIQHIYDKYGRDRAGLCATVIHYRPRSAIREVGKAMGLSDDVTGALAKTVWGSHGHDVGPDQVVEAGLDLSDTLLARTVRLASELIGLPRHLSQHVGGFILTDGPLVETVPIGNGAMPERSFIEWDKDDIDALNILKVDLLALGMLTCIRKCFDLIRAHDGRACDLAGILQDPNEADRKAVYDMLCKGDSVGVFQVESRAQMNMLPRLRPQEFYDLVIEVAIVRPGPIQGDMVHPYLRRRNGEEEEVYPSPGPAHDPDELKNILHRTKGVPIFQEQAMKIAMIAAEFDAAEANELRKAMATFRSRGSIDRLQDKMVDRMVGRGYDPDFAACCFNQIKGFGEYGFPESHAASFALLVYVSSWLKCHYTAHFAAALLNSQPMGFYAPAQIVRDAREHGVVVLSPDVNYSDWNNTLVPHGLDWALRLGLRQITGLGATVAARLLEARDRPFADVGDIKTRASLDRGSIQTLAAADAMRSMGLDRRAALWAIRGLTHAPALPLFQDVAEEGPEPVVVLPAMPVCEHVIADYQTLRLSLKKHPVAFLRKDLAHQGYIAAADLAQARQGQNVRIAGIVLIRQRPGSAKGVCFITIEDETGSANLVVWPKVMGKFRKVVMTARLVDVQGCVQRDPGSGVIHVVARHLGDRSDALWRLARQPFAPPLSRADEVTKQIPGPSSRHPRDAVLVPKSRDFH